MLGEEEFCAAMTAEIVAAVDPDTAATFAQALPRDPDGRALSLLG